MNSWYAPTVVMWNDGEIFVLLHEGIDYGIWLTKEGIVVDGASLARGIEKRMCWILRCPRE